MDDQHTGLKVKGGTLPVAVVPPHGAGRRQVIRWWPEPARVRRFR